MLEAQTEIIKTVLDKVKQFRTIGKLGSEVRTLLRNVNEGYVRFEPSFGCVYGRFESTLSKVKFFLQPSLLWNV